ncbi:aminoacetone oxidase family FAD-binding enzyme [Chitinophaga caeni]|uniref:Aminoacetone oxidase family FAD-binding enzyme n=1 Tax=Chitinophaga caeni TaxID=2029983 RepID=A0A291QW91_9BACT|nr:NAD(P)/FAD-dependent oxidoreductase [Chitinophaga caeni]ATL48123.1 aminoacetone oxidase family FAD-binding enzyme [Chitinophaga caeni]
MGVIRKKDAELKKLVVIGGGAAGFFCAVNAARLNPHLQVTILEKGTKLLSKVKVSGGGRCNVTHHGLSITEMLKKYPRGQQLLKKSFHQFFVPDTVAWFKERDVTLKTEADGRMFPTTDNSQTIIDCLLKEADKYNVQVATGQEVMALYPGSTSPWLLELKGGKLEPAEYVCIASGGYSQMQKFHWLQQLGHSIAAPVPSLFTFNMPRHPITELMGVTVQGVQVKIAGSKFMESGPLLITHWGFSGPSILRLSAWGAEWLAEKNYQFQVIVNWLPEFNEHTLREAWQGFRSAHGKQKIYNKSPFQLPVRLWNYLLETAGILPGMRWADIPAKEQNKFIKILTAMEFDISGKTTFKEEFVTCGGVQLNEIDANTMQSKIKEGIYFAGEVLNVDGITGGFNFQNAWTSGWVAATAIASAATGA